MKNKKVTGYNLALDAKANIIKFAKENGFSTASSFLNKFFGNEVQGDISKIKAKETNDGGLKW